MSPTRRLGYQKWPPRAHTLGPARLASVATPVAARATGATFAESGARLMADFPRGHPGVFRTLRPDYVPWHKIQGLWLAALCGLGRVEPRPSGWMP